MAAQALDESSRDGVSELTRVVSTDTASMWDEVRRHATGVGGGMRHEVASLRSQTAIDLHSECHHRRRIAVALEALGGESGSAGDQGVPVVNGAHRDVDPLRGVPGPLHDEIEPGLDEGAVGCSGVEIRDDLFPQHVGAMVSQPGAQHAHQVVVRLDAGASDRAREEVVAVDVHRATTVALAVVASGDVLVPAGHRRSDERDEDATTECEAEPGVGQGHIAVAEEAEPELASAQSAAGEHASSKTRAMECLPTPCSTQAGEAAESPGCETTGAALGTAVQREVSDGTMRRPSAGVVDIGVEVEERLLLEVAAPRSPRVLGTASGGEADVGWAEADPSSIETLLGCLGMDVVGMVRCMDRTTSRLCRRWDEATDSDVARVVRSVGVRSHHRSDAHATEEDREPDEGADAIGDGHAEKGLQDRLHRSGQTPKTRH